ncbi:MAG: phage tail assembly chaperone [Parvibaculum sp.]
MSEARFPWEEAMTLGLGTLRLPPDIFWRLTLPELAAAARAVRPRDGGRPMTRDELERLACLYPDAAKPPPRQMTER